MEITKEQIARVNQVINTLPIAVLSHPVVFPVAA